MVELEEIKHRPDGIYVTFKISEEEMDKEVGYDIKHMFSTTSKEMAIRFLRHILGLTEIGTLNIE